MYKGVIFDLDGTLLNSIDDLGNSVNRVLLNHFLRNEGGMGVNFWDSVQPIIDQFYAVIFSASIFTEYSRKIHRVRERWKCVGLHHLCCPYFLMF